MNKVALQKYINELIGLYNKTELYNILFYSEDRNRDFKLLEGKTEELKKRANEILNGSSGSAKQVRLSIGEGNI